MSEWRVVGRVEGEADSGLRTLDAIAGPRTAGYGPWRAARAHLLHRLGRHADAPAAFTRAASLTDDAALRTHLLRRAATATD